MWCPFTSKQAESCGHKQDARSPRPQRLGGAARMRLQLMERRRRPLLQEPMDASWQFFVRAPCAMTAFLLFPWSWRDDAADVRFGRAPSCFELLIICLSSGLACVQLWRANLKNTATFGVQLPYRLLRLVRAQPSDVMQPRFLGVPCRAPLDGLSARFFPCRPCANPQHRHLGQEQYSHVLPFSAQGDFGHNLVLPPSEGRRVFPVSLVLSFLLTGFSSCVPGSPFAQKLCNWHATLVHTSLSVSSSLSPLGCAGGALVGFEDVEGLDWAALEALVGLVELEVCGGAFKTARPKSNASARINKENRGERSATATSKSRASDFEVSEQVVCAQEGRVVSLGAVRVFGTSPTRIGTLRCDYRLDPILMSSSFVGPFTSVRKLLWVSLWVGSALVVGLVFFVLVAWL